MGCGARDTLRNGRVVHGRSCGCSASFNQRGCSCCGRQGSPSAASDGCSGRASRSLSLTFIHPGEQAILLERPVEQLQLPPAAVCMLEPLRSVDEAHPQQLLSELRRLRARFDWRVLGQLALVARTRERIDELAALEILDALQSAGQAQARQSERQPSRCGEPISAQHNSALRQQSLDQLQPQHPQQRSASMHQKRSKTDGGFRTDGAALMRDKGVALCAPFRTAQLLL